MGTDDVVLAVAKHENPALFLHFFCLFSEFVLYFDVGRIFITMAVQKYRGGYYPLPLLTAIKFGTTINVKFSHILPIMFLILMM